MRTRLKEAFNYLKVERKLDQKDVAALMNTTETTVSRNLNAAGEGRVNTDFLIRLNNAVGNIFNIQYIIDGSGSLVEKTGQTAGKERRGDESLTELVAGLINDVESLRRQLNTLLDKVRGE
ncbi:MAG: hypothetical protein J5630_02590 [Bacteroidaceae bacterium]|nr:hypothetical protein [Bacteroidaceae bacterium]